VWETVMSDGFSSKSVLIAVSMAAVARELVTVEYPDVIADIATDDHEVLYVRTRRTAGAEDVSRIERVALTGGPPQTLVAQPGPNPQQLAVGSGQLFWIAGDSLRSVSLRS